MKYYLGYRERIKFVLIFCIILVIQIMAIGLQLNSSFSFSYILMNLLLTPFTVLSLYLSMRSVFTPCLQVFKTKVILSQVKRRTISVENIKELNLRNSYVQISYLDEVRQIRKTSFSVAKSPHATNLYIYNGKFQNTANDQ